jgi:uncharacterized protein YndB with AHSA1/START domain
MTAGTFTAEPGSSQIVSTYVFDAPRERVFEAYTDPKLTAQWWGPAGTPLSVDELDVRTGGSWRFVMDLGQPFPFRGVYHKVTAPEQLVFTWQYEDAPVVILQTVTFEETADGKTKVTDVGVFESAEARDGMLANGMDGGSLPLFERLAKLL